MRGLCTNLHCLYNNTCLAFCFPTLDLISHRPKLTLTGTWFLCYPTVCLSHNPDAPTVYLCHKPDAKGNLFLFAETLPLVSLLWLVSIVCLLLVPGLPNRNPVARSSAGRDLATVTGKKTSSEQQLEETLLLHGRRCKGSRARIKLDTGPFRLEAAAC